METEKNKLYVGNLSYSITDESLAEMFTSYGEVTEAKVIPDKFSGRSKGFGFVTMADEKAAEKAIAEMNGKEVDGRSIVVNISRPKEPRPNRY
ncbi:MAG: RNA-binding protein [Patescibacteria group bacterium]